MKKNVLLFLKGIVIGTAMIIPGVSGGTLAISLGIYEEIISTISNFFSNFKKNIKFIVILGLGVAVSLAICSLILKWTFEHAPVPTILFFIGLIVGSVPLLLKKVKIKRTINITNMILILAGAFILIGISFLKGNEDVVLKGFTLAQSLKLIGVGFIAAGTLIIPGISGSFVLMTLGYYKPILNIISETIKLNNIGSNLLILIPFGIGVLFGVLVISKIIEYVFKKYEIKTYYVIIGFLVASIIEVFVSLFGYQTNIVQIVIGIVLFGVGSYLSLKVFKD